MAKPQPPLTQAREDDLPHVAYSVERDGEEWALVEFHLRGDRVASKKTLMRDGYRRVCLIKAQRILGADAP